MNVFEIRTLIVLSKSVKEQDILGPGVLYLDKMYCLNIEELYVVLNEMFKAGNLVHLRIEGNVFVKIEYDQLLQCIFTYPIIEKLIFEKCFCETIEKYINDFKSYIKTSHLNEIFYSCVCRLQEGGRFTSLKLELATPLEYRKIPLYVKGNNNKSAAKIT